MALRQLKNGFWQWDFYPKGSKGGRVRKALPKNIETREQAEKFILRFAHVYKQSFYRNLKLSKWDSKDGSDIETLFSKSLSYFEKNEDNYEYKNILNHAQPLVDYFKLNKLSVLDCFEPSTDIIYYYAQSRAKLVSNKRVNKELFYFQKFHNFWVNKGYCLPLSFNIDTFYLSDRKKQKNLSEKFYERLIEKFPSFFLNEDLRFIEKPPKLQRLLPDSFFSSNNGSYVLVEIQKERLDRTHAYKILEYRDKLEKYLKDSNENPSVRMIEVVIGDICSPERREFLKKYGIELVLLPIQEIEKIILKLLNVKT